MLRKFVCTSFRSSPGEGACGVMTGYCEKNENKKSPQITQISTDYKNKKNQCKSV
jgi:hypothetical protein